MIQIGLQSRVLSTVAVTCEGVIILSSTCDSWPDKHRNNTLCQRDVGGFVCGLYVNISILGVHIFRIATTRSLHSYGYHDSDYRRVALRSKIIILKCMYYEMKTKSIRTRKMMKTKME